MANLVSINLQVVDRNGASVNSAPALIYNQNLNNPFSPTQGSIVQSGNTGDNGRVMFTGIAAGTYDIGVVVTGVQRISRNYVVKNQYLVSPGTTSFDYESKGFVTDQTSTLSPGILTPNLLSGISVAAKSDSIYRGLFTSTGTGFATLQTISKAEWTGNSYYHTTSSLTFVQNAKIMVG
jgi:hypothetical protein